MVLRAFAPGYVYFYRHETAALGADVLFEMFAAFTDL